MGTAFALCRLLVNWRILQSVVVVIGAALAIEFFVIGVVGTLLSNWLGNWGDPFGIGGWLVPESMLFGWYEGPARLVVLYIPAGLGVLCGEAVVGLLLCPYAFSLPKVRTKLRRCLLAVGGSMALWVVVITEVYFSGQVASLMGALAFLAFGMGTALADPYPSRRLRVLSLLLFLWLVLVLHLLVGFGSLLSWFLGPSALVGGAAYLWHLFSPRMARAKAIAADRDMGAEYVPRSRETEPVPLRSNRIWPMGRTGTRTNRWVLASIYERNGVGWSGWIGMASLYSLVMGAVLSLPMLVIEGFGDGSKGGWSSLYWTLGLGNGAAKSMQDHSGALVGSLLWIFFVMFDSRFNSGLRKSALYPLSRQQRARIAFWGGITGSFAFLITGGVALSLLAAMTRLQVASEASGGTLPAYVRILLLSAGLLPLFLWFRLRYVDRYSSGKLPMVHAGFVVLLAIGMGVLVVFASDEWGRMQQHVPAAAILGAVLLGIAGVLTLYRLLLARHFARCDLV